MEGSGKIIAIGTWDKNGMPVGWMFEMVGAGATEDVMRLEVDGRVLVGGIEIVEWTEARQWAMGQGLPGRKQACGE